MKPIFKNSHSIAPIAIAEAGSTAVSLGAVWVMGHYPGTIKPLQDYVSRTVIYPSLAKHRPPSDDAAKEKLQQEASNRASLIIKGVGMIGSGFAAHLPLQLALEGKFTGTGFRTAATGKTIGVATALGSILLLNRIAPDAMPALQNAIFPLIKPLLPKDDRGRDSRGAEELAKLLIIDVPSSIVAGLINYHVGRSIR